MTPLPTFSVDEKSVNQRRIKQLCVFPTDFFKYYELKTAVKVGVLGHPVFTQRDFVALGRICRVCLP
jgi:hypothetical protein